jgi:hypothetical protein
MRAVSYGQSIAPLAVRNLKSVVRKILCGYQRIETERIALR